MLKQFCLSKPIQLFLLVFVVFVFYGHVESNAQAPEFGCCNVSGGSMQCQPGESWPQPNASEMNCESAPGPTKEWIPFEICTGAPPMCEPAEGCCVPDCTFGPAANCQDPGDEFFLDTMCSERPACQTGCCIDMNMCVDGVTSGACGGLFVPDSDCGDPQCAIVDPTGCCSDPTGGGPCAQLTQGECNVPIQQGLSCNAVDTCGPVGCCQGDNSCSETNAADCPDTWIQGDTCNGDFDLCNSLINGCCETPGPMCEDISGGPPVCAGVFTLNQMCLPAAMECREEVFGCCQTSPVTCENTSEFDCAPADFNPLQNCNAGFCGAPPPVGCCVLPSMNGIPNCEIETEEQCNNEGGAWQGAGVSCDDVPECNIPPPLPTNVPTLGQWGMIVIAAFLGIYSLMVLRKRNKLNVG